MLHLQSPYHIKFDGINARSVRRLVYFFMHNKSLTICSKFGDALEEGLRRGYESVLTILQVLVL